MDRVGGHILDQCRRVTRLNIALSDKNLEFSALNNNNVYVLRDIYPIVHGRFSPTIWGRGWDYFRIVGYVHERAKVDQGIDWTTGRTLLFIHQYKCGCVYRGWQGQREKEPWTSRLNWVTVRVVKLPSSSFHPIDISL